MAAVEQLVTDHLDLWTAAIKRRSTAGRGSSKKIELYGVQKLRELILELAVRGLLLPQDPNDEPASELLKKITAEKAKLVKEGKIKKDKPPLAIAAVAKPFELPISWAWQHLADVFYPISVSKNKVKTSEIFEKGKHPVVDQGQSFIAGYVDDDNMLSVLPGPVIVFGDHTSALKYIDFNFVAGADGVKILRPMCCDERYFFLVCKTLPIESRGYGRHYSRLLDNLFPLPPLAEQHRIVAKVDELMVLCDQLEAQTNASLSAHKILVETLLSVLTGTGDHAQFATAWQRIAEHFDTLFTTEESIDQLKQTMLELAVKGKLVPQDPNDEPASELLKRVAAEKAKLVKEGKIKADKPLPPIDDTEKPFELPQGWLWEWLPSISFFQEGPGIMAKDFRDAGIPLVRISGMHGRIVSLDGCNFLDEDMVAKKWNHFRLEEDDIILSSSASLGKVSKVGRDAIGSIAYTGLIRFKPFKSIFDEYLIRFLGSSEFARQIDGSKRGAAILHFGPTHLRGMMMPVPPLAEQHRIVAKIDELMALCDQIQSRLKEAQAIQLRLADAMSEQALAG